MRFLWLRSALAQRAGEAGEAGEASEAPGPGSNPFSATCVGATKSTSLASCAGEDGGVEGRLTVGGGVGGGGDGGGDGGGGSEGSRVHKHIHGCVPS